MARATKLEDMGIGGCGGTWGYADWGYDGVTPCGLIEARV